MNQQPYKYTQVAKEDGQFVIAHKDGGRLIKRLPEGTKVSKAHSWARYYDEELQTANDNFNKMEQQQ